MSAGQNSRLYFGCAGWSYKEWIGPFYDDGKSMLQQYAKVFDTVEIDSSFYRPPDEGMVLGLARSTKRGFMFSAKIYQDFTHKLKLKLNDENTSKLEHFVRLFDPLLTQDRLGCFLIQLPPSLKRNDQLLENFLAALPNRYDYVAEFRHESWLDDPVWKILSRYEVAYCIVDEPLLPPEIHITSPIGYIRWHGHGDRPWYNYRYSEHRLKEWVPKVREVQQNTKKTFGVFNNHFHGYAPENCIQIMEMLGISNETQKKALMRLKTHIDMELSGLPQPGTLEAYTTASSPGTAGETQ